MPDDVIVVIQDLATMSEERFNGIDNRLELLTADMKELRSDVAELKTDVAELKTDVGELKADLGELRRDVVGLKVETVDVRRHMGVLHEHVIDRIRGIREDDSLRQEMRAGFAMIMKRLDDHAIPGDAADRAFAATLADHERRITSLERTST
jgi:chromosome segregation ATPase